MVLKRCFFNQCNLFDIHFWVPAMHQQSGSPSNRDDVLEDVIVFHILVHFNFEESFESF
jgi:hypothetical protein